MPDSNDIHFVKIGYKHTPVILWAHGWGQNFTSFVPLAESMANLGQSLLIDFPGFGKSPIPAKAWSTADYADHLAVFIKSQTSPDQKIIWVGHSFGCRVGLQIAHRHPDLIAGLFLIAGAGLKRRRPFHKKIILYLKVYLYKTLKKLIPLGLSEEWLKSRFGSADYKNAGPMREILVKVINEDLGNIAKTIKCPVFLAYGTKDSETPPEIGQRLHDLIEESEFITFDGLDHYSILDAGRHQVAPYLKKFIERLSARE